MLTRQHKISLFTCNASIRHAVNTDQTYSLELVTKNVKLLLVI